MKRSITLRNAAIVLYASLAILWLAIPQSVTNWTRDYLPGFVQPHATAAAEAFEAVAKATHLPALYEQARDAFQSATRKQ